MQDRAESQEELLAKAASGDREAFSLFVNATQNTVYRLALAIAGNSADAEDILQETYLAAWRAAPTFRGETAARGWLLTIARHAAWRNGKRRARGPLASDDLDTLGAAAGWGSEDPERIAERAQSTELLRDAMRRLPPDYREILALRDLEGIPGEDVASMLGLALPAMKSRLHRARLALAVALRNGGFHG